MANVINIKTGPENETDSIVWKDLNKTLESFHNEENQNDDTMKK